MSISGHAVGGWNGPGERGQSRPLLRKRHVVSSNNPSNVTAITLSQKNQAGVTKYFTALPTLMLAGVTTTPAKVNAIFQTDIDATTALDAAEAALSQTRAAQKAATT